MKIIDTATNKIIIDKADENEVNDFINFQSCLYNYGMFRTWISDVCTYYAVGSIVYRVDAVIKEKCNHWKGN